MSQEKRIPFEEIEKMLKFGDEDERKLAILQMSDIRDREERAKALIQYLIPIGTEGENRDYLEQSYALIAILNQNADGFVRRTSPDLYEMVRDTWLDTIAKVINGEDMVANVVSGFAVDGLANAKDDETVSDSLIEIVRSTSSSDATGLVDKIFRTLGALGHENSREFLEYWKEKGNLSAQAAIQAFGMPLIDVHKCWEQIKAEKEALEKAEIEKSKKKILGIDAKLFYVLAVSVITVICVLICVIDAITAS